MRILAKEELSKYTMVPKLGLSALHEKEIYPAYFPALLSLPNYPYWATCFIP